MAKQRAERATRNRILSRLSAAEFALLEPHLSPIDLPLRFVMEARHQRIEHVYFMERGIAAVVANGQGSRSIEVGLIGSEGMTGLSVVLGTDRSINETFIQLAGSGQRVTADKLRKAIAKSASLHQTFLRYSHAFLAQTAQTALANGRSKIEERLARWLIMAHDRADSDQITMTHEFLSVMLGVRRAGVTETLKLLEKEGHIRAARGVISILDRQGLEARCDKTYGGSEAEYRRLFGLSA